MLQITVHLYLAAALVILKYGPASAQTCNSGNVQMLTQGAARIVACSRKSLTSVPTNGWGDATELQLEENSIPSIRNNAFVGYYTLTVLKMKKNPLTLIEGHALANLSQLQTIDFSENHLTTLPPDLFTVARSTINVIIFKTHRMSAFPPNVLKDLPNVRSPQIQGRLLRHMSGASFVNMSSLGNVDFGQWIKTITTLHTGAFKQLPQWTELMFENCAITTIEADAFQDLVNVAHAYFQNNKLTSLPLGAFNGLPILYTLNLAGNQLTTLPSNLFDATPRLNSLDLTANSFTVFPSDVVTNLPNLRKFSFTYTKIAVLDTASLSNLSLTLYKNTLYIKDTNLTIIRHSALENLHGLQRLEMNNSRVTTIEEYAFKLPTLLNLNLAHNRLTMLDARAFYGLENLEKLYVEYNNLATLPAGLFAMSSKLQLLKTAKNPMVSLPSNVLVGLPSFNHFDFLNDKLTTIGTASFVDLASLTSPHWPHLVNITTIKTGAFQDLPKFMTISFDGCKITTLEPRAFREMNKTESLNFNGNKIAALSNESFIGLPALKMLYLKNIDMASLPLGLFAQNQKLETLDLSDNKLTSVPQTSFLGLSLLSSLNLAGNSIPFFRPGTFLDNTAMSSLMVKAASLRQSVALCSLLPRKDALDATLAGMVSSVQGRCTTVCYLVPPGESGCPAGDICSGNLTALECLKPLTINVAQTITVQKGSNVSLRIAVSGEPRPSVELRSGSTRLAFEQGSGRRTGASQTTTLTLNITNAGVKDMKAYEVRASSIVGSTGSRQDVDKSIILRLTDKSTVTTSQSHLGTGNFQATCTAVGAPTPSDILWLDGSGKALTNAGFSQSTLGVATYSIATHLYRRTGTLQFTDPFKATSCSIRCSAVQAEQPTAYPGFITTTVTSVELTGVFTAAISSPRLAYAAGESISINCVGMGNPNVALELVSSVRGFMARNRTKETVRGGCPLIEKYTIASIQISDSGSYWCKATNSFGTHTGKSINITVSENCTINSPCHRDADCSAGKDSKVNCTCRSGFSGDGRMSCVSTKSEKSAASTAGAVVGAIAGVFCVICVVVLLAQRQKIQNPFPNIKGLRIPETLSAMGSRRSSSATIMMEQQHPTAIPAPGPSTAVASISEVA